MDYQEAVDIVRQAHKDARERELACKQIHEKAPRLSEIRDEAHSKSSGLLAITKEMRFQAETLSVVTDLLGMVESICKKLLDGYTTGTNSHADVEIRGNSDPSYPWLYGKLSRLSDHDAVQWLSARLEPFVSGGTIPGAQIEVAHTYAGDKLFVVSIPVFDE